MMWALLPIGGKRTAKAETKNADKPAATKGRKRASKRVLAGYFRNRAAASAREGRINPRVMS
jgi:hypothetical protein